MADTFRAPPEFLKALKLLLARPDASSVVHALGEAMLGRQRLTVDAPGEQWSLGDALHLLGDPEQRVSLFGALRLLQAIQQGKARIGYSRLVDEDVVRIDQALLMEFAGCEVASVGVMSSFDQGFVPRIVQSAVGLLGPNGVLPYVWTEHAWALAHHLHPSRRDESFMAWINVIQRRQLALLFRAWSDTQATVSADRPNESHPLADRLRALAGIAHADMDKRDRIAPGFKMAFAAALTRRVRNPQPLAAMLSRHFEAPVRLEEFVPRWLDIPADQATRIGRQFNVLGEDAVAGARVWDSATRFRIIIGPLSLDRYRQFLPNGEAYAELADLVSLYVGPEFEWELVPVLEVQQVPYSWLGNQGLLLGWSSWLGVRYEETDAGDLGLQMVPVLSQRKATVAELEHHSS